MENNNELMNSLDSNRHMAAENGYAGSDHTDETIQRLQSVINEKQHLLDQALEDLAKGNDCRNCANIDRCSVHSIERNFAYGGCCRWQWRGTKSAVIAS